ncbi:unnamed protein product [Rotaria sp. Silwood1]|nr:unnamed protein product [Rotaria sp. Silwood1]CAF3670411.1 unnamed protein product [Rotaria sp. Silwood1]CAF3699031.1 unnamed protein product [Rotaria sp. Silwood1]CAF4857238.1 unnamed protein product [Rotaria sp. Silwood1]CAF4875197.1 unnamed protein product [Rotaria sp. Silwood1]
MTECALLETAADYLKEIYNIITIHSSIDVQYGTCRAKDIFDTINIELDKLKIDNKRLSHAIDTIAQENTNRDLFEMLKEATHFDNEKFDDGALLISQRLDAAMTSMMMKDYEKARESFGALLHTVQDFYSHSNWIEIGHRVPNKGIGKYEILGRYASKEMRTCIDCVGDACRTNIVSDIITENILTSGYFGLRIFGELFDKHTKPVGKCSHGGVMDYTVETDAKGGGISKDTSRSDHGHLHTLAASVAYNATKQILSEFWTMIGNEPFGHFLGLATSLRNFSSNSLVIVMDDTGSMASYIEMAKQIAIGIVDIHKNLDYPPINYILSPFNDPTWGPLTISRTPEAFVLEISKLDAHDGGDGPELYYHGIVDALKACEIGSVLYAFTDAPAKDAYLKSQAIQLAKEKRVIITLFYANPRARQLKKQSGRAFINTTDVIEYLDIIDGTDLPSVTGGVMMGINAEALNATSEYIIQNLEIDKMTTVIFAKGLNMNVKFHVDLSIKSLKIEVTSANFLSPGNFRLIKPSGVAVTSSPTSQTSYILLYTIPVGTTESGEWTLISSMDVDHTIQVNAISQTICSSAIQKEIIDSSSNISFTPLTNQPIKEETDLFILTICENLPSELKTGYVNLIDANNGSKVLQTLTPIQISPTGFLSRLTVPNVNFRLNTVVNLQDGTTVQRGKKEIISPTSISLSIDDQPYFVLVNNTLLINYTLYNHGQTQLTITLRVIDTMGLLSTDGFVKAYSVAAISNVSDTIAMDAINIPNMNSNSTVITNSIVFSIAALDYKYDQNAPVYIKRDDIHLTNQTDYQKPTVTPPPLDNFSMTLGSSMIHFILYMLTFFVMLH